MSLFGLMLTNVVWAQDRFEPQHGLEVGAIAVGDFDCSGSQDQAVLWINKDGDVAVDLALGVPERELQEPFSGDAALDFTDLDGDRCDDLVITVGREEAYSVFASEARDILGGAVRGEGDSEPDAHLERRFNGANPWDFGIGVFTDWGTWGDDCSQSCMSWVADFRQCGETPDGDPIYCPYWRCVSIKMHCVQVGF